eukprot:107937-Pyramimonas_sp.AAC.1
MAPPFPSQEGAARGGDPTPTFGAVEGTSTPSGSPPGQPMPWPAPWSAPASSAPQTATFMATPPPNSGPPHAGQPDPWAVSAMGDAFKELREKTIADFTAAAMASLQQQLPAALAAATTPLVSAFEQKFEAHVARLREVTAQQSSRIDAVETQTSALEQRLAHLEKELDLPRQRPRDRPVPSPEWDRCPDYSIMVVRCPEEVPRDEVIKSITPWLEAANFTMGQE